MPESATPYPLKWPRGRPRTKASDRKDSSFRTSRDGARGPLGLSGKKPITVFIALERLDRELNQLGARFPVVSTNLELTSRGEPRSSQRSPDDPGVAVYFDLAGKPHCLPCDRYTTVGANIAAIAAHIHASRAIERYGVADLNDVFAAFLALPPPEAIDWRAVLQLHREPQITLVKVEAAYRRLAAERHPDRTGGSDTMMAALNIARDAAREELGG